MTPMTDAERDRMTALEARVDNLYTLLGKPAESPADKKTRAERTVAALSTLMLGLGAALTPVLVVVLR